MGVDLATVTEEDLKRLFGHIEGADIEVTFYRRYHTQKSKQRVAHREKRLATVGWQLYNRFDVVIPDTGDRDPLLRMHVPYYNNPTDCYFQSLYYFGKPAEVEAVIQNLPILFQKSADKSKLKDEEG